ncbi:MAG TPA: protoporphyrinogen oxidase [Pyrinomonadaceae bacterium]|nr:protoporphyrinogen oxidase [Pyrinomonadaceae bacterium]
MFRVVIIGGGITGLAAAHRLVEGARERDAAIDLKLLEAGSRLGGILQTTYRDDFLLELGPDSFISEKPEAIALAKRIGLETNLIETNQENRRSFIVRDSRLRPVPEGFQLLAPGRLWPFIKSDIFSWKGKARMAMDLILPRRRDLNGSTDESLAAFVKRRLGREALERMAQPMIGGIYTADPEKLSLRSTLPRLLEFERSERSLILALKNRARQQSAEELRGTSGARYSLFLSFDQGMRLLVERLTSLIPQGSIHLNSQANSLTFDQKEQSWGITLGSGSPLHADVICLCVPAYKAAELLRTVDTSLAGELEEIPYASTATVNLAYRRKDIRHPLNGFGFVVPFIEKRSLIACTFSSVKFAGRAPEDHVLLRAFVGGDLQPEMFALPEDEIVRRVQADLVALLGVEHQPLFAEVAKWRRSMPQYHVGHLERKARIEERVAAIAGLALAGNAYSGAGIPDCIRSGEAAADHIFADVYKRFRSHTARSI